MAVEAFDGSLVPPSSANKAILLHSCTCLGLVVLVNVHGVERDFLRPQNRPWSMVRKMFKIFLGPSTLLETISSQQVGVTFDRLERRISSCPSCEFLLGKGKRNSCDQVPHALLDIVLHDVVNREGCVRPYYRQNT